MPANLLRRLIIKELVDNACDACDAAGRPGEVEVEQVIGCEDTYRVADQGPGIPGTPEDIAALYALDRPMISSKFWRLPLRGAMGNGIRCIAGACAATNGTIEVATRGRRILLKPTKHRTEIVSVTPAPEHEIGTEIVITFGPDMPWDVEHDPMSWARATISLAKVAGPAYARRPSPHWFDAEQLTDTLFYVEPADTTVREFIAGLDGCSGARAGKIAAEFGKNRTCNTMNSVDAAALLRAAQDGARVVQPRALGPIGKTAFDMDYDGYACKEGSFSYAPQYPGANIPFLVEAWAMVYNREGPGCAINVMANRTAITSTVRLGRSSFRGKEITISGANLYSDIDTKAGDCRVLVHISSPFIPVSSIGKNPDLKVFEGAIREAIRLAFNQSRKLCPPDENEPKPPAAPKPEPKPKPEVFVPKTRLGMLIDNEASENGVEIGDLTVLSASRDPYRFDTAKGHAEGSWFAVQVQRFVSPDPNRQVHVRGLHYAILSSGDVYKPDGKKYINDSSCWAWLQLACKAARWLGYVPFKKIRDERNEPPEFYCHELPEPTGDRSRSLSVLCDGSRGWLPPALDTILPTLEWSSGATASQPFRIAFIAEKSSLGDVLRPIAKEIGADLLLGTGDMSDTFVADMAERAAEDGRPFVVLYFADFDPGGWAMPIAVSRKFQALVHLKHPSLEVQVHRVALTYEQAIEHDLPSTPLKDTERRKGKWFERWGREQTEIDALATLRPDILEAITREAIQPFYDPTLEERLDEANRLPPEVVEWFEGLPAYTNAVAGIEAAYSDVEQAIANLREFSASATRELEQAMSEAPEMPDAEPIEPVIDAEPPNPLFTSDDTFVNASHKLIVSKRGAAGAGEDEDGADEEDD